jgi:hypothetical protein
MVNSSRQVGIERDLPSCGEPQAEQLRTPNRQIAFERNAPPRGSQARPDRIYV